MIREDEGERRVLKAQKNVFKIRIPSDGSSGLKAEVSTGCGDPKLPVDFWKNHWGMGEGEGHEHGSQGGTWVSGGSGVNQPPGDITMEGVNVMSESRRVQSKEVDLKTFKTSVLILIESG